MGLVEAEGLVLQTELWERGFLPELRRVLSGSRERPASEVLPEVASGFRRLLADNVDLVSSFFLRRSPGQFGHSCGPG